MRPCPIMIGREVEIDRLNASISGGGGITTVVGEAGHGKSRIVREAAATAAASGQTIIWGRPEEVSAPGPYSLILDLLDNIAAKHGSVAPDATRLLTDLIEPTYAQNSNAVSYARHIAARLRGILAQLASPPLIILEDLHALDEASVAVIFHIAKSASDDGYHLVATYRPESVLPLSELGRALAVLEKERSVDEIFLRPLDEDESRQIIVEVFGTSPNPEIIESIIRLGEGVPFFIEELTSIAIAGGELPDVPQTITRSVEQQMYRLSPATLELVQVASLIGGPIDPPLLSAISAYESATVEHSLSEARGAGLLAIHEDLYLFRHTLLRRAVSTTISRHNLSDFHQRIASALEERYSGDLAWSWQIALHWHAAGDLDRAARYSLRAGHHALNLAATSDAQKALESARDWSTDPALKLEALDGLTLVAFREGRDQSAAELAQTVVSTLEAEKRTADAAAAYGRLALVLTRVDDPKGVARALEAGLELVGTGQHAAISARLLAQKGNFLIFYQGRFAEAEEHVRRAIDMAEAINANAIRAVASDGLAEIESWRGHFAEADRIGEESLTAAIQSEDPEAIGRTHNNHAVRLVLHGRPQLALNTLSIGHDMMVRSFGRAGVSSLNITRAWIHQMMGEPSAALECLKNLESVWMAWRGLAAGIRAWSLIERGELSEAGVVLSHAWQSAGLAGWRALADDMSQATPDLLELLPAEVSFQLAMRAYPDAAGVAQLHGRLALEGGQTAEWARSACLLARVLAVGGDTPGAVRALDTLRSHLVARPYPYFMACAHEIEGLIALAKGNRDAASESMSASAEAFASCSNSSDQARCHRIVAEIALTRGSRLDEAKERLGRSRELALRGGSLTELARAEASLRTLGVRPRAGRPRKTDGKSHLSAREEQIAAMVAEGATNPEIARRLFISEGTVSGYVSSSLRKLSLSSRAALAAWSAKAGLV